MRAIAPSLLIVTALATAPLFADTHADILEVVGDMAGALSQDSVEGFMGKIDHNFADYELLKRDIAALIDQAELSCSIESLKDEGDEMQRDVDLDWTMQIRSRVGDGGLVQRRAILHCHFQKEKKHWKIVSIKPLDLFDPAVFAQR